MSNDNEGKLPQLRTKNQLRTKFGQKDEKHLKLCQLSTEEWCTQRCATLHAPSHQKTPEWTSCGQGGFIQGG